MLIAERAGLVQKASKLLWEKPVQDQDIVAPILARRISWVSDELQKEDHLGKQPFVPKTILHWQL